MWAYIKDDVLFNLEHVNSISIVYSHTDSNGEATWNVRAFKDDGHYVLFVGTQEKCLDILNELGAVIGNIIVPNS